MATLNERDQFRQDERDNLRDHRVIEEDMGRRSAGSLVFGLILALGPGSLRIPSPRGAEASSFAVSTSCFDVRGKYHLDGRAVP